MSENNYIPERLQEIIDDFNLCVGQEKLMYLLELAEQLPPLPSWLHAKRDAMGQVHECMTPVFIHAEKEDGQMRYYFDIPEESPTVRGYGTILNESLDGLPPKDVLRVPNEFYLDMGLQNVITSQRLSGMGAILRYMKRLAAEKLEEPDEAD